MTFSAPHRLTVGRILAALLLAACLTLPAGQRDARAADPDPWGKISPTVLDEMARKGRTVAIVRLEGPSAKSAGSAADSRLAVRAVQEETLAALSGEKGLSVRHRYKTMPYLVAEVEYSGLGALAALPQVAAIEADHRVAPADVESNEHVGATRVQQVFEITGAGAAIAIVDSGIDLAHPDLSGAVIAGIRILNAGTTINGDVQDDLGHGTEVAGIITGDGNVAPVGIAPDAGLVVVKALDADGGFVSDLAAGIDWIVDNNTSFTLPVRFINLSLEVLGDLPAQCPCDSLPDFGVLTTAINNAFDAGIVCIAAAGNDGDTVLRYPACLSNVVSVGATFDANFAHAPSTADDYPTTGTFNQLGGVFFANCNHTSPVVPDQLVCFSNRNTCMDFAAPGYLITTTRLGSTTQNINGFGTSQSTAHVTGALALLQEAAPELTAAEMLQLLHETAVEIPLNPAVPSGAQLDRIDIRRAVDTALKNAVADWIVFE